MPLQETPHSRQYSKSNSTRNFARRSVFTSESWKEVPATGEYLQACTTCKLCWCHLFKEDHGPDLICFYEAHMTPAGQDIFRDLLDQSLHFTLDTNSSHQVIFRLCTYFLFNEDHILPCNCEPFSFTVRWI